MQTDRARGAGPGGSHAHMHLVPIEREGDLDFHGRHAQLTQEEFSALAKAISEKL